MEIFKMKKRGSYYDGKLLMFDGVLDGQSVYTFLSNIVLIRTNNHFYSNVKTNEKYFVNKKDMEVGDIVCQVVGPLLNLKDISEVDNYILHDKCFFKDRISIYNGLSPLEKEKLHMDEKIKRDLQDLQTYNRIIEEQGPIVKAYAKTKFRV